MLKEMLRPLASFLLPLLCLVYFTAWRLSLIDASAATRILPVFKRSRNTALDSDESTQHSLGGRFAYAYQISGCSEKSCYGYILNLIAAAHILRRAKSQAKIIAHFRMSARSTAERLDAQHEEWLKRSGVDVRYMKKVAVDNFGTATLEKFRVMEMAEFDRVLFMDSDVLPLCSMDYLFNESFDKNGTLSDFVMVSDSVAPFAGSFFLVTPKRGEFERIINIVRQHRNRAVDPLSFNATLGWGHTLAKDDSWKAWFRDGNDWSFYAVASDQGIMYHYFRYMLGNYTWIDLGKMETWKVVPTEDVIYWRNKSETVVPEIEENKYIARIRHDKYEKHRGPLLGGCGGPQLDRRDFGSHVPFRDYYHFAGGSKPWNEPILHSSCTRTDLNETSPIQTGREYWICALVEANRTLELGLDSEIELPEGNPLGGGDPKERPHLLLPNIELPESDAM